MPRKGTKRKPPTKAQAIVDGAIASEARTDEKPWNEYVRELAALKVQNHELDRFVYYFSGIFERDNEPMIVLIELLERLKAAEKNQIADLESVIDHIQDRLFSECNAGAVAASAFVEESGKNTATIFERVLGPR